MPTAAMSPSGARRWGAHSSRSPFPRSLSRVRKPSAASALSVLVLDDHRIVLFEQMRLAIKLDEVTRTPRLGLEVESVPFGCRDHVRNPAIDLDAELFQFL